MERWLSVTGGEGFYEVSDRGRVRRVAAPQSRGGYSAIGRVLTPGLATGGYPLVTLCINGRRLNRTIHRLVAEAFIGPRPTGLRHEVNHKDGNPANNRLNNLEWVTRARNAQHAVEIGLQRILYGEQRPHKLTAKQVRYIRRMHPRLSFRELGETCGVSPYTVRDVVLRRTWPHI